MSGARVRLENVWITYGEFPALRGVSIDIQKGSIVSVIGPSGCGKTTLLRAIAGLVEVKKGKVYFDEKDYTKVPPEERGIGMVFQDLALFPHLNVFENIAFGLRLRGRDEQEIKNRVFEVMKLVGLEPSLFAWKSVNQLSGGQQQRVALARALVIEPRVLLLDEPLSHLDYKIKQRLLEEIRKLQRRLGVTTIYVTHDQTEAMLISDFLAVMMDGKIVQYGSPLEVYEHPSDLRVASFFGDLNVIPSSLLGLGDSNVIGVRPEDVLINPSEEVDTKLLGVVDDLLFQGPLVRIDIKVDGVLLKALTTRSEFLKNKVSLGETVVVGLKKERLKIFGAT
ncbi:MAG: ABC transporter ATP-binding protein [Acidilobaceae archaeon]